MSTILSTLRDKLDAEGSTISVALGGSGSIAKAIADSDVTDGSETVAYIVSFDVNGGSGTVDPVACAVGSTVALPDGSDITAPSNKVFAGWGLTAASMIPVTSPYAATKDTKLYAVYWNDVN